MEAANFGLGGVSLDDLTSRFSHKEPPEFDITAMVDLVFMMNIYFLVTFVTVALAEVDLPSASHAAPLDADSAVVFTIAGGDGRPIAVYLGSGEKAKLAGDAETQAERIRDAVERGVAEGKTAVLLKAEKKVRLGDLFRVAAAATTVEGVKLNVAVMEKDKP